MTESEIKIEARLYALEWMVSSAMLSVILSSGITAETFLETARQQMKEGAQLHPFPSLRDPALSDQMSAEFETALDNLSSMQMLLLAKLREHQRGS
jgi:hypothetical protein